MIKGERREISITVEYSTSKEVFVPYGEDPDLVIGEFVDEMVAELPKDINGFSPLECSYNEC